MEFETKNSSDLACPVDTLVTWTRFFDMSSGGGNKVGPDIIWIEADEEKAADLFEGIFGRDPRNVTCDCCGADYSFYESNFDPAEGDWIVSKADIEKFECGNKLEFDSM